MSAACQSPPAPLIYDRRGEDGDRRALLKVGLLVGRPELVAAATQRLATISAEAAQEAVDTATRLTVEGWVRELIDHLLSGHALPVADYESTGIAEALVDRLYPELLDAPPREDL